MNPTPQQEIKAIEAMEKTIKNQSINALSETNKDYLEVLKERKNKLRKGIK